MPALIRRGSRGRDVEKLQKHLDQLFPLKHPSILRPDGSADGIFGPQTKEWVQEFQRTPPAIDDDGVVGPITWQKLKDKLPLSFSGGVINDIEENKTKKQLKGNLWERWPPERAFSDLSAKQKEQFLDELLIDDNIRSCSFFRFIQNHMLFLSGSTLKLVQCVELVISIPSTTFLTTVVAGPMNVLITTISGVLAWKDAISTNTDMYAVRAWAYTVTAWAMGKNRPLSSPYMLHKFENFSSEGKVALRKEAWHKMSMKTWNELESMSVRFHTSKLMMQLAIQFQADNQPKGNSIEEKLCYRLLKSREADFGGKMKTINWEQGYEILYPR